MSLNCKQLKTKYEELLQEKEKFVLELEKVKNGGDDKELKKIKFGLEKISGELKELLKYPGSIFHDLQYTLSDIKKSVSLSPTFSSNTFNLDISSFKHLHHSPGGELRGIFVFGDSSKYLFDGQKLITEIDGEKVRW